jgi:hypothetical protein
MYAAIHDPINPAAPVTIIVEGCIVIALTLQLNY